MKTFAIELTHDLDAHRFQLVFQAAFDLRSARFGAMMKHPEYHVTFNREL